MSSPELSDVFEREFVHEEDGGHSFDSSDIDGKLRGYYLSTSTDEEEREKSSWTAEYAPKTSSSRMNLALNVPAARLCTISSVMRIGSLPSLRKDEEYFYSCVQELNVRGEEVDEMVHKRAAVTSSARVIIELDFSLHILQSQLLFSSSSSSVNVYK
ncbi:hypothetical protein OROHE_006703 [Orobanche hederae]